MHRGLQLSTLIRGDVLLLANDRPGSASLPSIGSFDVLLLAQHLVIVFGQITVESAGECPDCGLSGLMCYKGSRESRLKSQLANARKLTHEVEM